MHWREVAPSEDNRVRLAVIGEAPDSELLTRAYAAGVKDLELPWQVVLLDVNEGELPDCITHLRSCGFKGVAVGNPFKAIAANLARKFYVVKHGLGVANALAFGPLEVAAQNTEVPAFVNFIKDAEPGMALVMGSGRAARSAVMGLFECGWKVRLWNRNIIRSRPFVTLFERYGEVHRIAHPDPAMCTMIVNATPLGRRAGEAPPVIWPHVRPKTICIDYVYRNVPTEFLRTAALRGFRTVDGRELLVEQAALALHWWTEGNVHREPMLYAVGFKSNH